MSRSNAAERHSDRRGFLHAVLGGALAWAMPWPPSTAGRKLPRRWPSAWAWVHGGRERQPSEWRAAFERVALGGVEGVLVSGGETALLADAAHAAGLAFHRWIWTLNRSGDRWVKEHHPEWFSVNRAGDSSLVKPPYVGYYQWVCPTRSGVRSYLQGVVDEIARDPDVDGVHLDYVRHPDVILPKGLWAKYGLVQDREYPEFDFCYCEECRRTFRDRAGRDPLALSDPSQDLEWRRFRWESVTGLVEALAQTVHAVAKPITAAVFPTPDLARRLVRQSWDEWPLDAFFPMLYHEFYEERIAWIGESAAAGVSALPPGTPLFAGLYLPSLAPAQLESSIRIAREAGASGVALFEMEGLSDAHLEAVARSARTG